MKKILKSLVVIGGILAITAGATSSYFSDTEKSEGNTLSAGKLDLKIDNTSYLNCKYNEATSWLTYADLTNELFFNFSDLKPGDEGEDTISLHVFNNDAWACFNITVTGTPENNCLESELEAGDLDCGEEDGELQDELEFAFWADDGDNVYEDNEKLFFGPKALSEFEGSPITLADKNKSVFDNVGTDGQLIGDDEYYYIGKVWCFGDLILDPLPPGIGTPEQRGSAGFNCDGTGGTNLSQSDGVVGTVSFYIEQYRNNPDFQCNGID